VRIPSRLPDLSNACLTAASVYSQVGVLAAGGAGLVSVIFFRAIQYGADLSFQAINPNPPEKWRNRMVDTKLLIGWTLSPLVTLCALRIFSRVAIPKGITLLAFLGVALFAAWSVQLHRKRELEGI
jgi:hypothetical protein